MSNEYILPKPDHKDCENNCKRKKILVVDNHPIMIKFIVTMLAKYGHQVQTAQDGLSALNILESFTPEIMFIDLVMPNINGEKLCKIIRSKPEFKDVFIVIMSAVAKEEKIDFIKLGANACIAKAPFNQMSSHILSIINIDTSKQLPGMLTKKIMGADNLAKRCIIKELLESRKHLENILTNLNESIIELSENHEIVYVNQTAILFFNIPEEKLLGHNFLALFQNTDKEKIVKLIESSSHFQKSMSDNFSYTLNNKQVLLTVLPILNENQNHVTIIINDIDEKKRMELQLQQSKKMEAIGTLSGGIAHDFNNLLMGIQGNTSSIKMDIDPTHPHTQNLQAIEKLIKSGARLTSQLMGYARQGKYEVQPLSLNEIVKETSETFGRTKKEITISADLAENLFTVKVDRGQIEQVLLNLYINAWQAMPGGGTIYLKTKNVSHKKMQNKYFKAKDINYSLLTVKDTGKGMTPEIQQRIFDPFFTTKKLERGTGLGLASAYGIIKNHSGYIDVQSEKGCGTTFSIYLPATKKKVALQAKISDSMLFGTETVLIVDDEDIILDVSQKMLEKLGYTTLVAKNGMEAIDIIKNTANNKKSKIPDLVLLDMIMPIMGGSKTYDLLTDIDPNIKVLLSSGYSMDGQAADILKHSGNGFIQKPFNMKELSEKIRKILDS